MEISENILQSNDSIIVNKEIKEYLFETSRWAKFLSILGFIGIGIMLLIAMFLLSIYSHTLGQTEWISIGIYVTLAIAYFFPINYLFKFSKGIQESLNSNDQNSFAESFRDLKSHYKLVGIFTIIIVSIYLLLIILSLLMIAIF